MRRYPAYKDSGVEWLGEVPEGWALVCLKHACHVFPSNVDKHTVEGETPVLLCNYTDVYYNEVITPDLDFMAATAKPEEIEKFTLQVEDVVFTKDSETSDDIGIAALIAQELPGVVCGYHLSIARPYPNAHGPFIKRFFDSNSAKAHFQVSANGLTRVGLGQYAIDNLPLALPPLPEQTAIAAFLDRETAKIDALVAEQRRLIDLLREKRQAVISHAVTKGLNPDAPLKPSGIDWLGDVPEGWEIRTLGSCSTVVRGASPRPAGDPRFFADEGVPWVTVAEITKDDQMLLTETASFLTVEGALNSRQFEPGTLLYSNSGATLGVPKILNVRACANDGVVGFLNLSTSVEIEFLYFFLSATTDDIREKVKQGSGQPNLNTDIVKNLKFALPPSLETQRQIVSFVKKKLADFDALTATAETAIALLQERRAALISAAVTGKIDVRHLGQKETEAA